MYVHIKLHFEEIFTDLGYSLALKWLKYTFFENV